MRLTWVAPNRNATLGLVFVLAFAVCCAVVFAQNPPAQPTPPAQQQAAPPPVTYPGDAAMVLNYIAADKTADFEAAMAKVKEALQKSTVPERKQQAAGWKVFRSPDPAGEGQVLYVWVLDPVVKGADYGLGKILAEGFPAEANEIFKKYAGAYAQGKGQLKINLNSVAAMGQ
jgi:hypothetical protein